MIYEIKTVDGVKTKVPLTGNGYGLPLGSIIAVYSNLVPDGYLPCNGATFDTTTFAALYAYLGSNRLPDLRECGLVGAGQSSNEYDADTNPNGIHAHDVYAVGEFKDDQMQEHSHAIKNSIGQLGINYHQSDRTAGGHDQLSTNLLNTVSMSGRTGTTTHGKQVGVNYCIKATPAYVEPDTVSDMVNTLRTQDSYSLEEVNTGKKWIDGKPIYRKCFYSATNWANNAVIGNVSNFDSLVMIQSVSKSFDNSRAYMNYDTLNDTNCASISVNGDVVVNRSGVFVGSTPAWVTIEYTKTTD